MDFKNFTIKAQEAVQKATELAGANQQQAPETSHLLNVFLYLRRSRGKPATYKTVESWVPTKRSRSRPRPPA